MSRLTLSSTSRKSSLRRYLMPSRRQPICPVTCDVICDVSSFVCHRATSRITRHRRRRTAAAHTQYYTALDIFNPMTFQDFPSRKNIKFHDLLAYYWSKYDISHIYFNRNHQVAAQQKSTIYFELNHQVAAVKIKLLKHSTCELFLPQILVTKILQQDKQQNENGGPLSPQPGCIFFGARRTLLVIQAANSVRRYKCNGTEQKL